MFQIPQKYDFFYVTTYTSDSSSLLPGTC